MAGRNVVAFEGQYTLPSVGSKSMRHPFAAVCGLVSAVLLLGSPAEPAGRELLILNRGGEAIFWVTVGHAQSKTWSGDVLPFNDVIDVGEGKNVTVPVGKDCIYDLRAKYGDGDVADLSNVDLCSASSVSFDH